MASTDSTKPALRQARAPGRGTRLRGKELRIGLLLFAVAAVLFTAWPQLDLATSRLFFSPDTGFALERSALVLVIHRTVPWVGRLCALLALAVVALQWLRPGRVGPRWRRRIVQLGWVTVLGTGLLVNGALKEGWGRARPEAVAQFGGAASFTPALQPTRQCSHNCSFVSGHAATGFAFMALGLFGSRATRRRYLLAGVVGGMVLGTIRIGQGGHFASDIVFAGLAIWTTGWLLREAWLRLRARRWRRVAAPPQQRP